MAASTFIATFARDRLLAPGAVTDFGALMTMEPVAVLPSMLADVLRRD